MPEEVETATEESTVEEASMDSISLAQLLTSEAPPEPEEAETVEAEAEQEEAEPEAEEQEAPETEPEQPEPKPGYQKRIDQLTAQKSELKERIDALEDQLKQKSDSKPAPDGQLQNISTMSELERVEREAVQNELWAKQQQKLLGRDPEKAAKNLKETFGVEPEDPEQFLDELELAAVELQRSKLPQARKRIEATQTWDTHAEQIYPWVNDPDSQNGAVIQDVLKKFGDLRLREIPMHKIMLARMVGGALREKEMAEKAQKPAPKTKQEPTPQPGKPAGAKPKKATSQEKAEAAARKVREGGGRAALAELIRAGSYQEQ